MSYYMGDFYQARGSMRGDPGFFSFLGKIGKSVMGLLPGGAPAAGALGALIPKASSGLAKMGKLRTIGATVGRSIAKHPVLSAAGAAGAVGAMGGMVAGRHMRSGGTGRHRRMNVTNVKALRRSIRRCHGFAKLAKRVLRFTSPRPPKGRVTFKTRAKKRIC